MADLYGPIQSRIDTAANWASANPTLLTGELGIATFAQDRRAIKVGNGSTAWNSLGYFAGNVIGMAGVDVTQLGPHPGLLVVGVTQGDGQIIDKTHGASAVAIGGILGGYVGTDTPAGTSVARIMAGNPAHNYGGAKGHITMGYAYAGQGATATIYGQWSGITVGGVYSGSENAASACILTSDDGAAFGYVADWGSTAAITTKVHADWNGLTMGYAVYGGYIYARQGAAIGTAYGRGAAINAQGGAAFGYIANGDDTSITTKVGRIYAQENGSFATGYVGAAAAAANAQILADDRGTFAGGFALANAGATVFIQTGGFGSFAFGYVTAGSSETSYITAEDRGAFALGCAEGEGTIRAIEEGAWAGGHANGGGISAGQGALAHGYAYASGEIAAGDFGSFAFGNANATRQILAVGPGGFAGGDASTGDILSNATGAGQFAVGTNDLANSLAIGPSIRFKGTTAAPASPRNGDFWEAGGFIYLRTGGVTGKIQVA